MTLRKLIFLLITITFTQGCKNKLQHEAKPINDDYFSKVDDCEEQKNDLKIKNKLKLYYFDSGGYISEDVYVKSPSYLLKKQLRNDKIFNRYANKNFAFFVFTQDCDIGITRTQNYKIRNFPTILLVDPFGDILLKKVGLLPTHILIEEIDKVLIE